MAPPPSQEPSPVAAIIAFTGVIAAIVISGVFLLLSRPEPVTITIFPPEPTPTPLPSPTPGPITVYVTGAVNAPESLVIIPPGSRVSDALASAGGTAPDADLSRVNLAGLLRDGDQIHVPRQGEVTSDIGAGVVDTETQVNEALGIPTPVGGQVVNVNTANMEELMTLPRIGEVTAARIIEYRETNGPFTSLADLDEVSGIGPSTLEGLAPLVVFD